MEHHVKYINPLQFTGWDEMVLSLSGYSIFHSRSWAQVLAGAYGCKPFYLTIYKKRQPVAVWPTVQTHTLWSSRKGVSLPFSDHCEPLVPDENCFNDLVDSIINFAHKMKWKTFEFRGAGQFLTQIPAVARYNLHVLDLLPNEKDMIKRLRNSTWRNIKKASNQQVEICIETSLESVKIFYDLNCLTRKHHGLPPQPFKFFSNIHRYILSKHKGIVVLAKRRNQIIAGAVFFHFGDIAIYKYGASHRDFLALRPNNLIMWEAIKWYAQRGYKQFDFGRTEPENRGLNQFKTGWGAKKRQIAYYCFDLAKNIFIEKQPWLPPFMNLAFRKMPVPILRLVGSMAYRHMA
ncbi:MAG: GNAT family N-acetyltransferase [Desulfobacteraceae bacterium]|nr:GNAT family N-acetyltransferase [Desulfobacteraceae bacterium]